MVKLSVEITVEAGDWLPEPDLREVAEAAVGAALAALPYERGTSPQEGKELSILFTDDAHIRVLNRDYRDQDKPTNVLSFPQEGPQSGALLGDIVLAFATVEREAALAGKPIRAHMGHLIVHGFLHLLGFDHEREEEAQEMEALERAALERMGIPDPYADA